MITQPVQMVFFGGGFNPPHIGHVMAVTYANIMGGFRQVYILPCWRHAFDKDSGLIDFYHRSQMCELAFESVPGEVSYLEQTLKARYTVDLIESVIAQHPDISLDLTLIVGSDNLSSMEAWHRWYDLKRLVKLFVVPRAETGLVPQVSSTLIREALARADIEAVRPLLPPKVLSYILENKLYGSGLLSARAE